MSSLERLGLGRGAVWVLIVILAVVVRLHDITENYVWYDEAFSVWISSLSPKAIWFHTGRDVHPPLYYLMLHGWMEVFGKTPFSIRVPSAIAGVLTVVLCLFLIRKIASYRASVVAGILLALLPIATRYSQEARMYTLEGLLLVGATLALVYWVERPQRYRYGFIYAVLMSAALYTHYYAVLAALAHWLYLIVLRLHPSTKSGHVTGLPWWSFNVLIAVLYVPWLFSLVDLLENYSKVQAMGSVAWLPRGDIYTLPDTLWRFLTLSSHSTIPSGVYWLLPVVTLVMVIWLVLHDKTKYRFSLLLTSFLFVPMLFLFCVSLVMRAYLERYVIFSAVALPMMFAWWLTYINGRSVALGGVVLLGLIVLEVLGLKVSYSQSDEYGTQKGKAEWRFSEALDYISSHKRAGDIVVVGGGFYYFSSVFYNGSDSGMYLYWPNLDKGKVVRPNGYGAGTLMYDTWDEHTIADPAVMPAGVQRVWWLTAKPSVDDHVPYGGPWREIDYRLMGKLDLRLYQAP